MSNIEVVDGFFPPEIAEFVSQYITYTAEYRYGEADNEGNDNDPRQPTGMVHNVFFAVIIFFNFFIFNNIFL